MHVHHAMQPNGGVDGAALYFILTAFIFILVVHPDASRLASKDLLGAITLMRDVDELRAGMRHQASCVEPGSSPPMMPVVQAAEKFADRRVGM